MIKLLTPIVLLFVFFSCTKKELYQPIVTYNLTIDSILTRDGMKSLPKDNNGIYHLKIIAVGSSQSHRVTSKVLVNGNEPVYSQKVEWESNMYWWIRRGDTLATITQSYVNYFTGQFTIVQLPPLISSKDELVPTINKASYSGTKGEINTMISPIREMVGDTMVIKAYIQNKNAIAKIVLE